MHERAVAQTMWTLTNGDRVYRAELTHRARLWRVDCWDRDQLIVVKTCETKRQAQRFAAALRVQLVTEGWWRYDQ